MKTLLALALFGGSLAAQTIVSLVPDTPGVPNSGSKGTDLITAFNANFAAINAGKLAPRGVWQAGSFNQSDFVLMPNGVPYYSLIGSNTSTPGISLTWQPMGLGPLQPATSTLLGGVIVPASGGLTVDGSGNLALTQAGILSKIGAAGLANSYLLYPYFTINGQQIPLGGTFTTPAIPTLASQITNAVDSTQTYSNPSWVGSLAWAKLTGVPTLANSFNGRIGAIVPATADYSASQVTNALDSTQSYSNPGWLTTLGWAKITGAPAFITANQTITISGDAAGSGTTAIVLNVGKLNGTALSGLASGILYNTTGTGVPSIASTGQLLAAIGAIPNSSLLNPCITLNGSSVCLGGSATVTGGSGGTYSLPTATSSVLGGVKVGSGLSIDGSGVLSSTGGGSSTFAALTDAPTANASLAVALAAKQNSLTFPLGVNLGGTGTTTPGIVAGSNITVSGTWPNQTVNSTASGSGTVTSVGFTMPSWLTVGNSPVTTTGTITVGAASGQTAHQVIGTCGSATSFAPCALVASDLPTIPATQITGVLPVTNGGTGTTTPGIVAGTNVTVTGTWPNQTVNSAGGASTGYPVTLTAITSPLTVLASAHGKGAWPSVQCLDASKLLATCPIGTGIINTSGDVTVGQAGMASFTGFAVIHF